MKYACQICGYVYDDSLEKIPFSELPDSWTCPLCGAAKSDFLPLQVPLSETVEKKESVTVEDVTLSQLSVGQLAAVCSNLSRGCEKQYMQEEAAMFKKLAEYFSAIRPAENDATVEKLLARLKSEISDYSSLKKIAEDESDRGAQRVCVWGEKVTRMLSSLVDRYLKQGDSLLEGTDIWVCTTCGFVYIGSEAPEICPVCKVPSWKFEKIDGRR